MNKLKSYIVGLTAIILFVAILINQDIASNAVIGAMQKCVYNLVPSLFASGVLTSVIEKSNILKLTLSKLPVDANITELFILSNIGGYPIGAKLISEAIYEGRIKPKDASYAMTFCFSPGPAFCIGVIGKVIYSSSVIGLIVWLITVTVNLFIYLITVKNICKYEKLYSYAKISTKDIMNSVITSANAMFTVTSVIVMFAVILSVIECYIPYVKLTYFTVFADITNIAEIKASFVASCVFVAFGGVCVLIQILGIVKNSFSGKQFILSLILRLPIVAFIALIFEKIIDVIGIKTNTVNVSQSNNLIPFFCVIIKLYIAIKRYPDRYGRD